MEFTHKKFAQGQPDAPRRNIKEEKMQLRELFREKRAALSADKKKEMDEALCRRLQSLVSVRYADEILSFSPLAGEIDINSFNIYVIENGKALYLPRCIAGSPEMNFHRVGALAELAKGSFSINEPSADAPIWQNDPEKRAICIIPAMSYDKKGFRLGYGKGYYDRYLSTKKVLKVGLCYTSFLSQTIPRGRYDLSVDIIVTEKGIITVDKKGF